MESQSVATLVVGVVSLRAALYSLEERSILRLSSLFHDQSIWIVISLAKDTGRYNDFRLRKKDPEQILDNKSEFTESLENGMVWVTADIIKICQCVIIKYASSSGRN